MPDLDEEMASHLLGDDDEALLAYARSVGVRPFIDSFNQMVSALPDSSVAAFTHTWTSISPNMDRLSDVLQREFAISSFRYHYLYLRDHPEPLVPLRQTREMSRVYADQSIDRSEKLEIMKGILADFERSAFWAGANTVRAHSIDLAADLGKEDLKRRLLYEHIWTCGRTGAQIALCQALGTMLLEHINLGNADSVLHYSREAMKVAEKSRLPEQAGRILNILGIKHYYFQQITLAGEHFERAQELCREFKGGYTELRFLLDKLNFYRDLNCWDLVEEEIPRTKLLVGQIPSIEGSWSKQYYMMIADLLIGTYHLHRDEPEVADSLFRRAGDLARSLPRPYHYSNTLLVWSNALYGCGYYSRGMAVAKEGYDSAMQSGLNRRAEDFHHLIARFYLKSGDLTAAESILLELETSNALFSKAPARLKGYWMDRATLSRELGRFDDAKRHLDRYLELLLDGLNRAGPGVAGYLDLDNGWRTRSALHRLYGTDTRAALACHLAWLTLPARIGGEKETPRNTGAPAEILLAQARQDIKAIESWCDRNSGDWLLFSNLGSKAIRWHASPDGLRCDTLEIKSTDLEHKVARMLEELGQNETHISKELTVELAELGRLLLPAELLCHDDNGGTLLVSAEGQLSLLPFEALSLHADVYRPLGEVREMAKLRYLQADGTAKSKDVSLVVGAPSLSLRVQRKYPRLAPLLHAEKEAGLAASILPNALLVSGHDATKEAVLAAWQDARVIYFATHLVRDPRLPYRSFIPLAALDDSFLPEASYLGFPEILACDLSGCRLVVLSSCNSGAGHSTDFRVAPSLADVFLDAGVAAVIQTAWPVRDDAAADFMREFMGAWDGSINGVLGALTKARCSIIRHDGAPRHPSVWAAYTAELSRLP